MNNSHFIVNLTKDYCDYKDGLAVHIALFKDVQNLPEILDKSIQENSTFVDASLILSLDQLLIAINKSLYSRTVGKSKMNSFFAEILFNLSISKNISDSLKQFGIEKLRDEKKANFVVITINKSNLVPDVFNKINGNLQAPSNDNLRVTCDLNLIKKIYKTDKPSLVESKIASKEFLH